MLVEQTQIPILNGITSITGHVAVWYWARRLAEAQGLVMGGVLTPADLLMKICGLKGGPQEAMKALPKSGQWDLKSKAPLPVDTVLYWADSPTHSAVVTGTDQTTGYNQAYLWAGNPVVGLMTISRSQILRQYKLVFTCVDHDPEGRGGGRFGVYLDK
jgi:hypothetical protein